MTTSVKNELMPIKTEMDIVQARQQVRKWSIEIGMSLVDQTKIITAASELARNTVVYGGGGTMLLESLVVGFRKGLKITFEDQGPGIPDLNQALKDGFTSGKGMGLGLGGAKRLSNEFEIKSEVGKGTHISMIRWK